MRTIKFRAWDESNKIMINPYCELKENKFWGEDLTNTGLNAPTSVMQFTGLTDRNGVEIYENDIIYFLIDNEKYAVEFHEGAFCLVSENINVSISMYDFDNSEYEVIGNIHDTPELL